MNLAAPTLVALGMLALSAAAQRQQDREAVTLESARATFTRADGDTNAQLSAAEASAVGIDARSLAAADGDGNGSLSRDEFLVAYHQGLVRQSRAVAADLEAESTRLQALRRAQRSEELKQSRGPATAPPAAGPGRRARADVAAGGAPPSGAPAGPAAARRAAAESADPQELRAAKLHQIEETLNRRLRNGELTDEEAKATYERMKLRIDNALGVQHTTDSAAAPAAQTPAPAGASADGAREQQLLAIQESLNRRLRNADLSNREAIAAFERTNRRIENALNGQTGGQPAPADGAATAAGAPAESAPTALPPDSLRARVAAAQSALTRRVRNGQVDPATAAAAQEALRQRIERAVSGNQTAPGQPAAPAAPAPAAGRARRPASEAPPSAPPRPRGN
jgi:hypothetical protein